MEQLEVVPTCYATRSWSLRNFSMYFHTLQQTYLLFLPDRTTDLHFLWRSSPACADSVSRILRSLDFLVWFPDMFELWQNVCVCVWKLTPLIFFMILLAYDNICGNDGSGPVIVAVVLIRAGEYWTRQVERT